MIHAVVLAAGRSRRMGTQKLLLPIGGQPVIARVVDALPRGAVDRVWVVIGPDGEQIRLALADRDLAFVTNPDTEGDMLSSVRCGLRALPAPWDAVLVVVGDQPALTPQLVRNLVCSFQTSRSGIAVPTCRGKRGHPILIARLYLEELLTHHDSVGLRGLLQAHPADVIEVQIEDPAVLEDMDRLDDYARMTRRFEL
jgi:molybdenum cofactor cytidylyltransferase